MRRPISSLAGRFSRRISLKNSERGSDTAAIASITRRESTVTSRSSMYQPPTASTCSISSSASTLRGLIEEAQVVQGQAQALGVVVEHRLKRA